MAVTEKCSIRCFSCAFNKFFRSLAISGEFELNFEDLVLRLGEAFFTILTNSFFEFKKSELCATTLPLTVTTYLIRSSFFDDFEEPKPK